MGGSVNFSTRGRVDQGRIPCLILVVNFDVVVAVAGVVVVVEFVEAIVGFVVADDSLVVEFDVIFEIVKRIFRDYVGCVQLLFDQMKYS
uniref:Uncharacterized protein n=1 Tax=Strongyloides papillosus TaxID=174720 RepID=A0A0N5BNZ5_STREA